MSPVMEKVLVDVSAVSDQGHGWRWCGLKRLFGEVAGCARRL